MNKIEIPEINFHIYAQMIFDKVVKTIQWGKDSLSTSGTEKTQYQHAKIETETLPYAVYKN